ncbi:MAG: phosphoadenosine phosphosulfate reductase [Acidimicrobiaceae bacterium]|nr:phosphoadenosine phosphosulfate reductase [Acidimicrobiaceae bacterium]
MASTALTEPELATIAAGFESAAATRVIRWAVETFGADLCLTASMTDAVLIDLAVSVDPNIEIVFIDTQYHFAETLDTVEAVRKRYNPNLRILSTDRQRDDLWRTDTDACCQARKVVPLEQALAGKRAWMSGLRRVDDAGRAATPIVHYDKRGLVKVNPIATWTDDDVAGYIADHDVIVNPLIGQGYPSIGCWPCTRAVQAGEDVRAGRWSGTAKTECGLHE